MSTVTQETVQKVVQSLQKNWMGALYFATAAEAKQELLNRIPAGATIGVGGSLTVRNIGLAEALEQRGNPIYDHWRQGLSPQERSAVQRQQTTADVFLTSTNALTLDGKLINTDASGNRVASMFFGPPQVYVVTGVNKIVKNVAEGLARIKKISPQNCRRLKTPTPCVEDLKCHDCELPGRICRVTTIIEKKPFGVKDLTVVLVGEELGY